MGEKSSVVSKLKAQLAEQEIDYVLVSFVELTGAPKAKLVPVSHIEEFAHDGAGFAGFACGHVGQGPHDPDICSIPDFSSLTVLPWRKDIAWVTGNLFVNGESWPFCPRTVLMRQLEQARKKGYIVNIGIEPEFMLLKKNDAGEYTLGDPLDSLLARNHERQGPHRVTLTGRAVAGLFATAPVGQRQRTGQRLRRHVQAGQALKLTLAQPCRLGSPRIDLHLRVILRAENA